MYTLKPITKSSYIQKTQKRKQAEKPEKLLKATNKQASKYFLYFFGIGECIQQNRQKSFSKNVRQKMIK